MKFPATGRFVESRPDEFVLGRPVHLAVVKTEEASDLFVDGRRQNVRFDFTTAAESAPYFSLGAAVGNVPQWQQHFQGRIHRLRVSDIPRHQKDYTPEVDFWEPDENTLGLYDFREGEGAVLHDRSGNGRDGKIVGAQWVQGLPRPSPKELLSRLGGGLSFDGVNDHVQIANDWAYDGGPLTIEVWATPAPPVGNDIGATLVHRETAEGSPRGTGFKFVRIRGGSPEELDSLHLARPPFDYVALAPHILEAGVPTHFAATFDGNESRIFFDGRPQPSGGFDYKFPPIDMPSYTWFGASPSPGSGGKSVASAWAGWIHRIRISSSVRYQKAFEPQIDFQPDAETQGLYRFDERTGAVLNDASGHGRHGKIFGATWLQPGQLPAN